MSGGSDGRSSVGSQFSEEEYEAFVERVVKEPWVASRETDTMYDISIAHPDRDREVLIDSARDRVALRDPEEDEWGIRQKPVSNLGRAVDNLLGAAVLVPMSEARYIGLGGHPKQPESVDLSEDIFTEE